MVTVACVYWQGKFRGRENVYSPEWVGKLKNMVGRNMNRPYQFVCFSNVDVPCDRIPLKHKLPGWWSKLELFRWDNGIRGRILYLDLDVVILKNLSPFIDFDSWFGIMGQPKPSGWLRDGGTVSRYNSSVMVWDTGPVSDDIWGRFSEGMMEIFRGDQDWIGWTYQHLDTFPSGWVEKLRNLPNGQPRPENKIVLVMPGKNEIASRKHEWIRQLWK